MTQSTADFRTSIMDQLLVHGAPQAHASEAVDIAMHAASEALSTMSRVLMSASSKGVTVSAAGIAVSIARHRLNSLEAAMIAMAEAAGVTIVTGEAEAPHA